MKNRFLVLMTIVCLLWSCNDENFDANSNNIEEDVQSNNESDKAVFNVCLTEEPAISDSISGRVSYKNKYWKLGETITIKFMSGSTAQQNEIIKYAQEWTKYANLKFRWVSANENADIRIKVYSDKGGGWSNVGTDCRLIPQNIETMAIGMADPNPDGRRYVVLHEFGHALNLGHEHQNPSGGIKWNKPVVYDYFEKNFDWSKEETDFQVLDKFKRKDADYSYIDAASIMIYYIPKEWTLDGFSSKNNGSFSNLDLVEIGLMYPFSRYRLKSHALYRYYNANKKDHLYTTNWYELKSGKNGYKYESYLGYLSPTKVLNTKPLHRYWNAKKGDHFYTTDFSHLRDAKYGWRYEGFMGYIYTKNASNRKPLYQYWNKTIGDHFYTTNWNELKKGNKNWKYQGIVGYLAK